MLADVCETEQMPTIKRGQTGMRTRVALAIFQISIKLPRKAEMEQNHF
jgi:hypothetical protein